MKLIDKEEYLEPFEAQRRIEVNSKTIQRWIDAGKRPVWQLEPGHTARTKCWKPVSIEVRYTRLGNRLYKRTDIERLLVEMQEENRVMQQAYELLRTAQRQKNPSL